MILKDNGDYMDKKRFHVKFWGVRGSSATSIERNSKYGSNTSCVEVQINNQLIILDAGTGIYPLGEKIYLRNNPTIGHVFISHSHYDHIQGLPFFAPLYCADNTFYLYGEQKQSTCFQDIISNYMMKPYFPVPWNAFRAKTIVLDIVPKQVIRIDENISISSIRVNHPGGNLAFRINANGKTCCYLTDIEHREDFSNELINFARNADIVIYDASLTTEEYSQPKYIGWGHSTWSVATKFANDANIKKLVLFHHAINKNDDEILDMQNQARTVFPNTIAAYEGLEISL